jgi:hypothetical protein
MRRLGTGKFERDVNIGFTAPGRGVLTDFHNIGEDPSLFKTASPRELT